MMGHGRLTLGSDGHLTKADEEMIHAHFACIVKILVRDGMDKTHIYEFLLSLAHNWWMSVMGL